MTAIKFPSDHGYLCGDGVRFSLDNLNHISMFEDESHNCIDIKGFINGKHLWDQYFYWDYEDERFLPDDLRGVVHKRRNCQKDAEQKFLDLVEEMERYHTL